MPPDFEHLEAGDLSSFSGEEFCCQYSVVHTKPKTTYQLNKDVVFAEEESRKRLFLLKDTHSDAEPFPDHPLQTVRECAQAVPDRQNDHPI